MGDFSVVLLRPYCMLVYKECLVKIHKNQSVWAMLYPPDFPSGATSRGHSMTPEAWKPSQWLYLKTLPREMCSQRIASKAVS
jgi:hypothetical protein